MRKTDALTIFAVNKSLDEDMEVSCDLRSVRRDAVWLEHIVLTNDDKESGQHRSRSEPRYSDPFRCHQTGEWKNAHRSWKHSWKCDPSYKIMELYKVWPENRTSEFSSKHMHKGVLFYGTGIFICSFSEKQHRTANRFISASAAMVSTGKLSTTAPGCRPGICAVCCRQPLLPENLFVLMLPSRSHTATSMERFFRLQREDYERIKTMTGQDHGYQ